MIGMEYSPTKQINVNAICVVLEKKRREAFKDHKCNPLPLPTSMSIVRANSLLSQLIRAY